MINTFKIVVPINTHNKLHIKHLEEYLPIIEWVCSQIGLTISDVDTSKVSVFKVNRSVSEVTLMVQAKGELLKILLKYEDLSYTITPSEEALFLQEVIPVILVLRGGIDGLRT